RQDLLHLGVQLRDDIARRSGGHHEAEPAVGFEAFQRFPYRRDLRQGWRALTRCDAERAYTPRFHVWQGRRNAVEEQLHVTRDEVSEPRQAALVGHVQRCEPAQHLEQLLLEMSEGSN